MAWAPTALWSNAHINKTYFIQSRLKQMFTYGSAHSLLLSDLLLCFHKFRVREHIRSPAIGCACCFEINVCV